LRQEERLFLSGIAGWVGIGGIITGIGTINIIIISDQQRRLFKPPFLLVGFAFQFIPQGPGPPHLPHMLGGTSGLDADCEPTAKTLNERVVCFEPHLGHSMAWLEVIDFISFSKSVLQDLQVYSYTGIGGLSEGRTRRPLVAR
jgi:hypothetical protein